jgi:hypothetical protein
MRLKCDWRNHKILTATCGGDQMTVDHGGKVGPVPVCEVHAKALQAISPMSGARFTKVKQQGGE